MHPEKSPIILCLPVRKQGEEGWDSQRLKACSGTPAKGASFLALAGSNRDLTWLLLFLFTSLLVGEFTQRRTTWRDRGGQGDKHSASREVDGRDSELREVSEQSFVYGSKVCTCQFFDGFLNYMGHPTNKATASKLFQWESLCSSTVWMGSEYN